MCTTFCPGLCATENSWCFERIWIFTPKLIFWENLDRVHLYTGKRWLSGGISWKQLIESILYWKQLICIKHFLIYLSEIGLLFDDDDVWHVCGYHGQSTVSSRHPRYYLSEVIIRAIEHKLQTSYILLVCGYLDQPKNIF